MNGMTATCFTTYSIQVSLVDEYAYRRPGRVLAYDVFAEFMAGGMGLSLTLWCDVAVDDGIGGVVLRLGQSLWIGQQRSWELLRLPLPFGNPMLVELSGRKQMYGQSRIRELNNKGKDKPETAGKTSAKDAPTQISISDD